MSTLNRDKAREVLRLPYGPEDNWEWDLKRLEACIEPGGYTEDQYGDLLRRTGLLDQKLARIAALCDRPEATDAHDEPLISVASIRAVLRGDA